MKYEFLNGRTFVAVTVYKIIALKYHSASVYDPERPVQRTKT